MSQCTPNSYEEWLEKSDLIRRIHFYDKQLSKLHVELDEFLTFCTDDLSQHDLENIFNHVKELDSKTQDVISLMFSLCEMIIKPKISK